MRYLGLTEKRLSQDLVVWKIIFHNTMTIWGYTLYSDKLTNVKKDNKIDNHQQTKWVSPNEKGYGLCVSTIFQAT